MKHVLNCDVIRIYKLTLILIETSHENANKHVCAHGK